VRLTVGLPTDRVHAPEEFVTGEAIAEMAAAAERAGFDGVHVTDHPAPDSRWLAGGGHHALDPMVALAFAAAATTRLRLQTHIMVLAYRNPLLTAKSVLSLDVLSGGRVILGVAAGYLKPEFGALGVDFDERNELTDEAIDVLRAVWRGEEIARTGRHFNARGVAMRPVPARPLPIWVGGNSAAAIRRAAERGDGWVPFPNAPSIARTVRTPVIGTLDDLATRIDALRDHAAAVGRPEPLDVCFAPLSLASAPDGTYEAAYEPTRVRDEIAALAELGVTWCVLGVRASTRAAWIDGMERLAADLRGA
jgi:probable F420-dependent oxidoreductase